MAAESVSDTRIIFKISDAMKYECNDVKLYMH